MQQSKILLIGLPGAKQFTDKLADILGINPIHAECVRFSDGELLMRANNPVRGQKVYLIQATAPPVNDNLMQLLIGAQALKLSSAQEIIAIIPYFGYARQDRKSRKHEPITSKLVAQMLQLSGIDRVCLVDIHSSATVGYFNLPVDNIQLYLLFCIKIIDLLKRYRPLPPVSFVSPDHGGVLRVRKMVKLFTKLNVQWAVIDKLRPKPNQSKITQILGNIQGRLCFLIDDMIDTGGSIINAARALKERGALAVYVFATHGVFSGKAQQLLKQAIDDQIITAVMIANTIEKTNLLPEITVLDCADWIAKFILCIEEHRSFSGVYENLEAIIKQQVTQLWQQQ